MIRRFSTVMFGILALTACQGTYPPGTQMNPGSTPSSMVVIAGTEGVLNPLTSQTITIPDNPIQSHPNGPILVPNGTPAFLDGVISDGEWDNAEEQTFADGSELFLFHSGGYLYVAIRAVDPGTIAGNVFIQSGEEIKIMHSSAALGTAKYQKEGNTWTQTQNFTWRCRNTSNSESALNERAEFFQKEEWLAANGLMGTPNELEYQIKIPDDDFLIAVVYVKSLSPYEHIPWPVNLTDDTIKQNPGGLPVEMNFSIDIWGMLEFIK